MATVSLIGAEFKRFYTDASIWGDDDGSTYVEDETITVDSVEVDPSTFDFANVADVAIVKIEGGYLANPPQGVPEDYVKAIKHWLRKQSMRQVVLEVPADKLEALINAAKALGAKEVKAA